MKIKANTLWETRANEIAYQIKYLELYERKIYFAKTTPERVRCAPHFGTIDYKGKGLEATPESRHIEVVTFDYSDNQTIKHLIEKGVLIEDKTQEYGKINNAVSLIKPPIETIPSMYSSFANKGVLSTINFDETENSEGYRGVNNTIRTIRLAYEVPHLVLEINGSKTEVAKTYLNSDNDIMLSYLFRDGNQNRPVSIQELIEKAHINKAHDLNKALNSLGIKGKLREAFFVTGKGSIMVHNPLTPERMSNLKISEKDLRPQ